MKKLNLGCLIAVLLPLILIFGYTFLLPYSYWQKNVSYYEKQEEKTFIPTNSDKNLQSIMEEYKEIIQKYYKVGHYEFNLGVYKVFIKKEDWMKYNKFVKFTVHELLIHHFYFKNVYTYHKVTKLNGLQNKVKIYALEDNSLLFESNVPDELLLGPDSIIKTFKIIPYFKVK